MSDVTVGGAPGASAGAEERTGADRAAIYDVSQRTDVHFLHKHAVGLAGVLFLTVTGAAPISAMLFNTPIAVGFGNGIGAPAGFLFATIILAIFSIGYTTMAARVTATGGFYSFISHGLGREIGMGAGFASVVAYSVFEASLAGGFAYFLHLKLASYGVQIVWPLLALFMIALIGVLTYFDIRLSARVLGVALIGEVIILLIMDVGIFGGGGNNVDPAALNPVNAFKGFPGGAGGLAAGGAGVGIFFAFWSWVGFEMAPNYGEESKEGDWAKQIMSWLIITGSFACGMAFHNTAARYFYSLGRERVMPRGLSRTHARWKSPWAATLTQSAIAAFIVFLFWIFVGAHQPLTEAYLQLYGLMAVMGVIIILSVQALVSLAIFNYFRMRNELHPVKTVLAPLISFVAQGIVLYLLFHNLELIGSGYNYANYLGWIDLGVFLVGIAGALWLKRRDHVRFDNIGRLVNEGV